MTRILIIEDDDQTREMLAQAFVRKGYEVEQAVNGAEGYRKAIKTSPEVLVTDILMPEKDGLETIRDLRKRMPDTRIIAVSGGGHSVKLDYLPAAKLMGADLILYKPVDPIDLLEKVEQLLQSRSS
jgi:DNA-binding response OmpR family regulator